MIRTKRDLREYVAADAKANGRSSVKPRLMGDEIWKFILTLRKLEYHTNRTGLHKHLSLPFRVFYRMRLHRRWPAAPCNTTPMPAATTMTTTMNTATAAAITAAAVIPAATEDSL